MIELTTIPLARRPELVIRPLGDNGQHVVKDPGSNEYYSLGDQETFLLTHLNGRETVGGICDAFRQRFGEPLSADELEEFLAMAHGQRFLQPSNGTAKAPAAEPAAAPALPAPSPPPPSIEAEPTPVSSRPCQSVLYWRVSLFDPDRLFTWLAPKFRFLWTRTFLFGSLACILAAALIVATNWQELVTSFAQAMRWETVVVAWLTLLVVTTCHEFAHGLTCKHFGGEVHEVGFLLMFFMPCLFCNVSDAWLFKEKSKRLCVTLAGGYCDICVWAVAVFICRLTVPDHVINYLAYVVMGVLSFRIFFNFNPLLKLDGYYLLSDFMEVPNLQQRSLAYLKANVRCLLWGGPRPGREPRGWFLIAYGALNWLFAVSYLALLTIALTQFFGEQWGAVGIACTLLLGALLLRGLFHDFLGGEVRQMLMVRHRRAILWALGLTCLAGVLLLGRMQGRAAGSIQVRSLALAEVRSPVAGFLKSVSVDEGSVARPGQLVVCLEVPNLASRIRQIREELRETEARLRLLEVGPRPELVAAHQQRVERALAWRDLAQRDLDRAREAFRYEMSRLDSQIALQRAEAEFAQESNTRALQLVQQRALAMEQQQDALKRARMASAMVGQVEAVKRARLTLGTQDAETELNRRERELAEARSALALLEAGSRPEEIEVERARLARLEAEACYLGDLEKKCSVHSPIAGLVTTPRLAEKVGHYYREGELICVVEEISSLEVEILLPDQEMTHVAPGQEVEIKARAQPFRVFRGRVDRIAPRAAKSEVQSTTTVYCRLERTASELRPGMSGYARIYTGEEPIGAVLLDRILRFVRTEFWW